jgi:hypothetical protein
VTTLYETGQLTEAQFVPALDELPETQVIIEKNFAAAPGYQM